MTYNGTIHPSASFDETASAEALERAMRGAGVNKQKVIDILVKINNAQRQMIRTPYKTRYGKDLETELKKELSGELEDVIVALMQTPTKEDASELQRAVKGLGTNEKIIVEILATRTNEEIAAIRNVYFTNYGRELEEALGKDTSGDFKKLITILLQAKRDESDYVDSYRASQDAQNIVRSMDKKSGIEKFDAWKVLATTNARHCHRVLEELASLTGKEPSKIAEKELSGDARLMVQALIDVSNGKPRYFANRIYEATKGLGTRDRDLIRVLVSRSEIDLVAIDDEYRRLYKKSLVQVINEECKGPYRDALLLIVKGNRARH